MISPDWYWVHGLHDAKILSVLQKDIPWNPSQKIPDNNCLIMKMDCNGAMFEQSIAEIRFYNYKILTGDFDLNILNGGWWLSDELNQIGERYLLELRFETAKCKTKRLEMRFGRAEVIRDSVIKIGSTSQRTLENIRFSRVLTFPVLLSFFRFYKC